MRKYKILIIENDEDEQLFMREAFENGGFEILAQLESGNQLMEWLNAHQDNLPDLILSDLNMPGRNGYDITSDIKSDKHFSYIPVIITSTSSAKSIMDKCYEQGASLYMVKPDTFIEYSEFVKRLRNELEQRQLLR